jgi:triosephosphate isomerase
MGYWRNCFSEQVQEMHEFIRETVRKALEAILLKMFVYYGGSVKPAMPKFSLNQM